MNCNSCGKTIPDDSTFCPYCGGKIEKKNVCISCGSVIPDDSVFCPVCGKKQETVANTTLKPVDSAPVVMPVTPASAKAEKPPRTKKQKRATAWIIAIVVIVLLVGGYIGSWQACISYANQGAFSTADKLFVAPFITKLHDPKLNDYLQAGLRLEEGNYKESEEIFRSLGDYRGSITFMNEADYLKAGQYFEDGNYNNAIIAYQALADVGYKDSADLLLNAKAAHAKFYAEQHKAYSLVSKELKELKNAGYSDITKLTSEINKIYYDYGAKLYGQKKYTDASLIFKNILDYKDSSKYYYLAKLANGDCSTTTYNKCLNNTNFKNTKEVLVSYNAVAEKFLAGSWKGNGYYFNLNSDTGYMTYNFPVTYVYGTYQIKNGIFTITKDSGKKVDMWKYTVNGKDSVSIYVYSTGKSFTMTRQ